MTSMTSRSFNAFCDAMILVVAGLLALFGQGGSTFPHKRQEDDHRYLSRKDREGSE